MDFLASSELFSDIPHYVATACISINNIIMRGGIAAPDDAHDLEEDMQVLSWLWPVYFNYVCRRLSFYRYNDCVCEI